jgi:hypothetical protein
MTPSLLEELPPLLAQSRRHAQRLFDARSGRFRERAVVHEIVVPIRAHAETDAPARSRLLAGDPLLLIAALLAEQDEGAGPRIGMVVVDLRPAPECRRANDAERLARFAPRLALLRRLLGDARPLYLRVADDESPTMRMVLEGVWEATLYEASNVQVVQRVAAMREGDMALFCTDEDAQWIGEVTAIAAAGSQRWIACMPHATSVRARRALLQRGDVAFSCEVVGAAPGEWARRHVGSDPVAAMHAALDAFGAVPLLQKNASTTATGRRRAGMEVLMGECVRDGLRTLVWVDAPDRRTGDATLCRAIAKRDIGAPPWDRVVVLGWHFVSTFAQHLRARCDSRVDALSVRVLPRAPRMPLRIDMDGFRPVGGIASAWIDRQRSASTRTHEWLSVQWPDDGMQGAPVCDWSVDPDHDGIVFRGAWHALQGGADVPRTVRLRLPWRAGPRRVCIRAFDADGGMSEFVAIVRVCRASDRGGPAPRLHAPARADALC